MRALILSLALACGAASVVPARQVAPLARMPGSRVTTDSECAASLGTGARTRRTFCDVITSTTPADSVTMVVPAHTGETVLLFDLHNRFPVPMTPGVPGASYARHEALIDVIRPDGGIIGRAAVIREFRTTSDLFDQLTGGGRPGGVKGIGPGPPEAVRFTIPSGVSMVGIVGDSLRVRTAAGGDETFDAPGRPVAIVSNLRLEYRPAR